MTFFSDLHVGGIGIIKNAPNDKWSNFRLIKNEQHI
jgi:hypothetical protein